MARRTDPRQVAQIMLSWLDLKLDSCIELQTLWAGYGHICAIKAKPKEPTDSDVLTHCILKLISPPGDPRGMDEGHLRKMLSYDVEQIFYSDIAPGLGETSTVAKVLSSTRDMQDKPRANELQGLTATLMEDLRTRFPVAGEKRAILNDTQVSGAIEWLASFHSSSWATLPEDLGQYLLPPVEEEQRRQAGEAGSKLWLNGGYTYLATRRKEYSALARDRSTEWCAAFTSPVKGSLASVAEIVADFLTPSGRPFETYIHGDVKSENLFTTETGGEVTFFDFQYVGLGLGACDLAKLFTCTVPLDMLTDKPAIPDKLEMDRGEMRLLEQYYELLLERKPSGKGPAAYEWDDFIRHWETALVDWCRFQASWGFWGNTEWLEARVRSILADEAWMKWLKESTQKK